jgi:hypothetical protein
MSPSTLRAGLEPTELTSRRVGSLMTGLAHELAVRQFVVTTGAERLLVVELVGGESTVSVVRAPTRRALTRAPSSLAGQTLY